MSRMDPKAWKAEWLSRINTAALGRRLLPRFDRASSDGCTCVADFARPACEIHDELYWYALDEGDRFFADSMFRVMILDYGRRCRPAWERPFWFAAGHVRYAGVRLFGRFFWRAKYHVEPAFGSRISGD